VKRGDRDDTVRVPMEQKSIGADVAPGLYVDPDGVEWYKPARRMNGLRETDTGLEALAACRPAARYPCAQADVAKLVDARDLKSLGPKGCAGSIPAVRTNLAFE
jgi:hypothetical protein